MTASRHLPLFAAALIAGISYYFFHPFAAGTWAHAAWKGSDVGLLALWASWRARSADGWLLTAVLALGAVGDVLLDVVSVTVGAVAFLAGHVVAIVLYLRNRRSRLSGSQATLAMALLVGTPSIAWLLPSDRASAPLIALYASGLGAMAASAWASRFPRYRVGIGALLFVFSDLLIFAQAGPLAASPLPHLLIWPTYFAAQALIAWGVSTTLARDER